MKRAKNKSISWVILVLLFLALAVWWIALSVIKPAGDFPKLVFGASYGAMALFGGIYGIATAKRWGFLKSSFGRAVLFLGVGLLMAEFGQLVFSYYNIISEVEIPYPSIADIGFFGNMVFYVVGGLFLTRVLGVGITIKKAPIKLIVSILLPLALLSASYVLFLKGYDGTESTTLQKILDFGYPLGDAVYVSIALVSLLSVGRMLGGLLKGPLLAILLAFIVQYSADFNFLYQNQRGTWLNGGYGDFLYLFAYTIMTASLIYLSTSFKKIGLPATENATDTNSEWQRV